MSRMRKIVATGGAGIEGLRLEDCAIPVPGPGEVLVRLRAASLNYRDLIGVKGLLPGLTKTPDYVPLSCGCGVVEAIGAGVQRVRPGVRVMPLFDPAWLSGGVENMSRLHLGGMLDGVARDYALFGQESLVRVPDTLSDLEAATLPCAGITAWSALFGARHTQPGDIVVLQGTGGVSIAALQFAKAAGAEVIITSASDAKLARARMLGADHLINYRMTPGWGQAVRDLTGGRGADVVVDVVGGTALAQTAASLHHTGIIAAVGMLEGEFSWGREAGKPVVPVTVGNREQVEAMLRGIVAASIRPVVDRVYPINALAEALTTLQAGAFFGKIGITLS
jgi:NADPH:quinone reductase-like Zn-dependent oxidoreductase